MKFKIIFDTYEREKKRKEQELINSINQKSCFMKLEDIPLFELWEITEKQFKSPSDRDKQRYDSLLKLGYENWLPVILIENNLLFDGYHRYAIAKYMLKKEKLKVVHRDVLTKEEDLYIRNRIIKEFYDSSNKVKSDLKEEELPCGESECGLCGLPNPLNTHDKKTANYSLAVLASPKFQSFLAKEFGKKEGLKRLKCEYERVRKIAIEIYGINVNPLNVDLAIFSN
jgi:hypothetical protein